MSVRNVGMRFSKFHGRLAGNFSRRYLVQKLTKFAGTESIQWEQFFGCFIFNGPHEETRSLNSSQLWVESLEKHQGMKVRAINKLKNYWYMEFLGRKGFQGSQWMAPFTIHLGHSLEGPCTLSSFHFVDDITSWQRWWKPLQIGAWIGRLGRPQGSRCVATKQADICVLRYHIL